MAMGQQSALFKLKRSIDIGYKELKGIYDDYDFREGSISNNKVDKGHQVLTNVLNSRGSTYLQDIVRTIQEEQDGLIREKANCYLLINGVAGSGKTTIAYHRVALLLYRENKSIINVNKPSIIPPATIIFGPSRLFLSYVKELLPDLGVKGVIQTSFDDWALEQMRYKSQVAVIEGNKKVFRTEQKYRLQDSAIAVFLDRTSPKEEKTQLWKRARLKGGIKYKTFIERYVDFRFRTWKVAEEGYSFSIKSLDNKYIILSLVNLREIHQSDEFTNKPINIKKEFYFSRVKEIIANEYPKIIYQIVGEKQAEIDKKSSNPSFDHETIKLLENQRRTFLSEYLGFKQKEILEDLFQQARVNLDRECPVLGAYEDYYALMENRDLVSELSKGLYSKDEVNIILSTKRKEGVIELEDIPAIFYLYILANGKSDLSFDHIVIDEAQDFSPLQFSLLSIFNPNRSMTILGDINQGIYAHRGLHNWDEVVEVLGKSSTLRQDVNMNYRSTNEITTFTNAVLKQKSKGQATLSVPFERKGEIPKFIEASSQTKMFERIARDIEAYNAQGINNIGIIVKKLADVENTYQNLRNFSSPHLSRTLTRDDEFNYEGGNLIIPVDLSKGIEFEAVLIVGADRMNYDPEVDYDGRLLYVGITRALHALRVYSYGPPTPYFDQARVYAEYIRV